MKALITGGDGQVARALLRLAPPGIQVIAASKTELNLVDSNLIRAAIDAASPDVVVNTAAYTAVDRAESDREAVFAANVEGVRALAECCARRNTRLIHLSTDYVFDGRSTVAYEPHFATCPVNVYGASKLKGEQEIAAIRDLSWTVIRTSWLYAPWGRNFLLTMIKLMRERGSVAVVGDQTGSPTSVLNLARFIWKAALTPDAKGILHYADSGVATWYDFAVAIHQEALTTGLLARPAEIRSTTTSEYETAAKRPRFSVLSTVSSLATVAFSPPPWPEALKEVMRELAP